MAKTATAVLTLSVLLMGLTSMATATHEIIEPGDERESNYIGSQRVAHRLNEECADALGEPECPTRIPRGLVRSVCDYSSRGTATTGYMYKGEGGTRFCQIQKSIDNDTVTHEQFIRVKYVDIGIFDPDGIITCPVTSTDPSGDVVSWQQEISVIQANDVWVNLEVPTWCDPWSDDHEHRTYIVIFNNIADIRDGASVGGATEGEAFLEVLSPLPGI